MARIPTILSGSSSFVGSGGALQQSPSLDFGQREGSSIASGLNAIGEGLVHGAKAVAGEQERQARVAEHQQKIITQTIEKRKDQDDALEIATTYSALRTDWNKRLIEYQQNPSEDQLSVAASEYDDYVSKMLEGSSNDTVLTDLKLKAAGFRLELIQNAFRIEAATRAKNFGASFDQMLSNAQDSIYSAKSVAELMAQKSFLNETVDSAVKTGRIKDPETVQGLKSRINSLSVGWAEMTLSTDPEGVIEALEGKGPYGNVLEGVPLHQRSVLQEKANNVIESQAKIDKLQLSESHKSAVAKALQSGNPGFFDGEMYEKAFGPTARKIAESDIDMAVRLHSTVEGVKGADSFTLAKIQEKAVPTADKGTDDFHRQKAMYDDVQRIVAQAQSDKLKDPYAYFSQNPAIKPYFDDGIRGNEGSAKMAQYLILEAQKADGTIPASQYRIMPKAEASDLISQISQAFDINGKIDSESFRRRLIQFEDQYRENMPIALNQLMNSKGEQVVSKMSPLLWHSDNPSLFRLVFDSIKKDDKEVMARFPTPKQAQGFLDDVRMDKNMAKYEMSMLASNNGAGSQFLSSGVRDALRSFSRDYVLNGGKINEASDLFFSPYTFGQKSGIYYARPRQYSDEIGKHFMSDDEVKHSNNFLDFYPSTLDPKTIDPVSILNETRYFTSQEIEKDVTDALRKNVFWSTTEDESGVYMFTKGSLLGAPRQVLLKDGTPLKISFKDTLKPLPMVPFGNNTISNPNLTTDSAMQRFLRSLEPMGQPGGLY